MRKVLVLSTSRGDARGLSALAAELDARPGMEVRAVVSESAAPGWQWLTPGGRPPITMVKTGLPPGTSSEMVAGAHRLADATLDAITAGVDLLVVMGDRHELLPALQVALISRVPVAHLSGGDITEGAFDDSIRHAISKLADLHFCSTAESARRLHQMGEEPGRVHVSGEPALDLLARDVAATLSPEPWQSLGISVRRPAALLTYHPPTNNPQLLIPELEACFAAAAEFETVVATHPSSEPGAAEIVARLDSWSAGRDGAVVVPQLGLNYPAVLSQVDAVIGNSSSGVVEAATFSCPVIDVGDRQRGRLHPANVIHVPGDPGAATKAAKQVLDPVFRQGLEGLVNPYGDGHAAQRIADVICALGELPPKRFVDVAPNLLLWPREPRPVGGD